MCLGYIPEDFCCEIEKQKAISEGRNEFSCCGNKFKLGEDGGCAPVITKLEWVRKNWRKYAVLKVDRHGKIIP